MSPRSRLLHKRRLPQLVHPPVHGRYFERPVQPYNNSIGIEPTTAARPSAATSPVVATALDKERSTSFAATVVGQDGHSQPDIASELEPEAGHKTHTRLLDAHQTPPLASAVATAAATAPTADFEPPPPATVSSVCVSQPHGPTPAAARDLASPYMDGPTKLMIQPDLAALLSVAAVANEPLTALDNCHRRHDRRARPRLPLVLRLPRVPSQMI